MPVSSTSAAARDTTGNISARLARFAIEQRAADIPAQTLERARYLVLDAVGIALASTRHDFAHRSLSAIAELSGATGTQAVIGLPQRLQPRDSMLMNGILVHGLDYDDTHAAGVIHATASCFPAALGVASLQRRTGLEMLAAYVVGVEVAARIGAVAQGGFHQVGFHPTGLVGAFACALIASRLLEITPRQAEMAQGIALSVGAGSLEFLQDGAWTKRMHPGWAAACGYTSAALARHGFVGPEQAYEGRFGLYASHLGPLADKIDLKLATEGLGETWETNRVTVKPIPACHFTHACADSAAILRDKYKLRAADIKSVRALVPLEVVKTVCEPVETKRRPQNSYDAQFSIPYIVATALLTGGFRLQDLDERALRDPDVLALAARVDYEIDPRSPFPKYYSGEVVVTTHDGRELRHRELMNRGAAERPITNAEVEKKFMENATLAVNTARAEAIRYAVLNLHRLPLAADLAEQLRG